MAEGIIEGFFKLLLLWVCIVAAGAFLAISTKSSAWRITVLILSIGSIPAYITFEVSDLGKRFHKGREMKTYRAEAQAFQAYCVGRRRSTSHAISPMNASVEISFVGINSFERPVSLDANGLTEQFTSKAPYAGQLCRNSGLRYLEGRNQFLDTKQFRFPLCPTITSPEGKPYPGSFPREEISESTASYKLVFGDRFDPAANPVFPQRSFTKIQVRLVESATSKVVAEDTLFFLGPSANGNGSCPNAYAQIHEMLMNAFVVTRTNSSINSGTIR